MTRAIDPALASTETEEAAWASEKLYRHLFNELNDAAFVADVETGVILEANRQAEALLGSGLDEIIGTHQSALHPPDKAEEYRALFATHIEKGHAADFDAEVLRKDGTIVPVSISASTLTVGSKHLIVGLFRDMSLPKEAEEVPERLIAELRDALNHVRVLSGLLPIWAQCKKIRDDRGYWRQIELYISEYSDAEFTHGICPECAHILYPEIYESAGEQGT